MKSKTRARLERAKGKSTGGYQDPIRLYDRPFWFDVWFLVGMILTIPDILTSVLILVKADFSWELANSSISGYPFLVGQTLVLFCIGSLLPAFIRRALRRGKLKVGPNRSEPGFYTDPIRKGSQRYWDGFRWTAELLHPYKRETARKLFLCGVFFAISLLLGLGSAVKGLASETLKASYEGSQSLAAQLEQSELSAPSVALLAPEFAAESIALEDAVLAFPDKEGQQTIVDGVPLTSYAAYSSTFSNLSAQIATLAGALQGCDATDKACMSARLDSSRAGIMQAMAALPALQQLAQ